MKTIGYIVPSFPVLSETFIGNEIRAMQARGHKVVLIAFKQEDGPAQPEDFLLAATATYLNHVPNSRATNEIKYPSKNASKALSFIFAQKTLPRYSLFGNALKIAAVARENGCDHLHAHSANGVAAHAIVAARWIGATVSFVGHGLDVYKEPEDLKLKLKSADIVISLCDEMSKAFAAYNAKAQVAMVPCGVNTQRFYPAAKNKADNDKLIFVGRLRHRKGVEDILEAATRLGDQCPKIDIVGDGPLRDTLEKRANENGLLKTKITFLGFRPTSWIASNVPHYKGIILPFKASRDGMHDTRYLVIKEAMAMGLPIITTSLKEICEIITDNTGLLIEPGNPHQLSQAIVKLMSLDNMEREALNANAHTRVKTHYSLDTQARALSGLFEMIEPSKPRDKVREAS
ncbi:MAG: glycosyltransferase family 4 protein [Hyphomicrobiales bacterium]